MDNRAYALYFERFHRGDNEIDICEIKLKSLCWLPIADVCALTIDATIQYTYIFNFLFFVLHMTTHLTV